MSSDARQAYDDFYRGTSRRTMRYAFGLTGDLGDAQDLTQEAYVRAWQRWHRLREYDSAEAWLRSVIYRLATDRWRRLAVRRLFAAKVPPAGVAPAPSEDTLLVVAMLRELPPAQRRALVLHYLLDRPVDEIAAETGVPVGTVKSWLSRGRSALALTVESGERDA
ncbi:SigE family RNA polymerase sigma factor [Dactylosporangium sp. CA-152071]